MASLAHDQILLLLLQLPLLLHPSCCAIAAASCKDSHGCYCPG
jgi:hypothetical protein